MKNKKDKEINKIPFYILLSILAVFVILFIIKFVFLSNHEPPFTIYKEECRNETLFNYEGSFYEVHEFGEIIWEEWENNWNRYYNLGCDVLSKHGVINASKPCELLVQDIEDYNKMEKGLVDYFFDGIIDKSLFNTKIEEICEFKDVEEIDLGEYEEFVFRDEGTLTCFNKCYFKGETPENYSGFVQSKRREEYDIIKYEKKKMAISKQGLTIDWLDINCECEKWKKLKESKLICFDEEGTYPCGGCVEYSCGENYIVEVEK